MRMSAMGTDLTSSPDQQLTVKATGATGDPYAERRDGPKSSRCAVAARVGHVILLGPNPYYRIILRRW